MLLGFFLRSLMVFVCSVCVDVLGILLLGYFLFDLLLRAMIRIRRTPIIGMGDWIVGRYVWIIWLADCIIVSWGVVC